MRPRHLIAALSAALLAPLTLTTPATASTGGTADTANTYSNVGLLVSYTDGERYRCSGTLVSPTVVLTAAHCTDGVDGKVAISFKPVIAERAPAPLPVAKNPADGYTEAELAGTGYVSGTPYTHPAYSDFTDTDNWNDVGVVRLDQPVTGVTPATLAPTGTLDRVPRSKLAKTLFRAVGYGTEVRKPASGPQKPQPMTYPLIRRYVDMPGQKLTPQILQTNGNPNDPRGTGGTCFGDSGGPVFYGGKIVAVTSFGYTDNCRYLGGYQRVDITVARDWLRTFGVV